MKETPDEWTLYTEDERRKEGVTEKRKEGEREMEKLGVIVCLYSGGFCGWSLARPLFSESSHLLS